MFPGGNAIQYIKNGYLIDQIFNTEGSMQQEKNQKQIDPMLSFHLMKVAFQDYRKSACNLTEYEYCDAYQHASEEMLLHRVILTSTEACCVVIPEALLKQTLTDVIREYPSSEYFNKILQENNMSLVDYTAALHNDLRVETVLSRITSSVKAVTAAEMAFYFSSYKAHLKNDAPTGQDQFDILNKTEKALCKRIDERHGSQPSHPVNNNQKPLSCKSASLLPDKFCHEMDSVLSSVSAETISISKASSVIYAMLLKKKRLDTCRAWLQTLLQPPA